MHRNIKRLVQELLWGIDRQTVWTDHQFRSGAFFRTRASISRSIRRPSRPSSFRISRVSKSKGAIGPRTEQGAPGTTNGTRFATTYERHQKGLATSAERSDAHKGWHLDPALRGTEPCPVGRRVSSHLAPRLSKHPKRPPRRQLTAAGKWFHPGVLW